MTVYIQKHVIPRPHLPGAGQWRIEGLTDVTVLVGKNGSGKSILFRSWRDQHLEGVHYVAPERTGEMDFQPHLMQEEMGPQGRQGYSRRNFVLDYRRRILGRIQTYFMLLGNSLRGSTQTTVPTYCKPDNLENLLSTLVADFEVQLRAANPPWQLIRTSDKEQIGNVDQLSSGEVQLLTMGLDILTIAAIWKIENRPQRILLLDEPDAHIHPDLQARFADFLLTVAERFSLQCVVATHSTSLLAALGQFGGDKASVIFLDRTRVDYVARRFDAISKEIASCLGGHVVMGPLFGAPILLVEGDDDYRIWGHVPRHHVVNLAVIPCNGEEIKRYQLTLERILNSLCEPQVRPVGFALLDGDKPLPTPNPDNPQCFMRFIRLNCRESENLYLTDTVLATLGLNWPDAAARLAASHTKFGPYSEIVREAPTWDRRNIDLKKIIEDVATMLDTKNVPWTMRVGAAIGKGKPAGELADFLGVNTVDAFWP